MVETDTGGLRLDREAATALVDALEDALTDTHEFLHTVGRYRTDGAYVVERRGADSAGHRKVFETPGALDRLVERLPETFTAADLTRTGLTGGRRHLVLRHVVEHPRWDYELVSRQPLRAQWTGDGEARGGSGPEPESGEVVVD